MFALRITTGLNAVAIQFLSRQRVKLFSSTAAIDLDFRDNKVSTYMENIGKFLNDQRNQTDKKISDINVRRLRTLSCVYDKAREVLEEINNLEQLQSEMASANEKEMAELATSDINACMEKLRDISNEALQYIVPHELQDTEEILMEFSAGIGGQEAMLFSGDLFQMYTNHARNQGWGVRVMDLSASETGGLRSASLLLSGPNVGRLMKFESGVHRVQRTPKTERTGRIHTSTATVAVLPCPVEVDVVLEPKDLTIKYKRSSGPGGQHVNTTESAVQILHVPTGIQVDCESERSQIQNRDTALKMLRTKIYELEINKETAKIHSERKLQVGSAARSEKIRTYNFAQDRVTDHRIGISVHNLPECLAGGRPLSVLIDALQQANRKELADHLIGKQLYN